MKHQVFVYGSLMSGLHNHDRFLKNSEFVGPGKVGGEGLAMVSLGQFPGIVDSDVHDGDESFEITGEVYEVNDKTLADLDRFEDVPRFYDRRQVTLASGGEVWMYILAEGSRDYPLVRSGDWRAYKSGEKSPV